jgi:putative endonuclease
MTLDERQARYRTGLRSEWKAALALRLRGYRILARRWQSSSGEIDLVAVRGKRLAFIEVKHRPDITE